MSPYLTLISLLSYQLGIYVCFEAEDYLNVLSTSIEERRKP